MILVLLLPMVILFALQSAYDPSKTTETKIIEVN